MERALALDGQRNRRNENRRARYRKERDLIEEHAPKRFRSNAVLQPRQTSTLLAFSVNVGSATEDALRRARLPGPAEIQGGG